MPKYKSGNILVHKTTGEVLTLWTSNGNQWRVREKNKGVFTEEFLNENYMFKHEWDEKVKSDLEEIAKMKEWEGEWNDA